MARNTQPPEGEPVVPEQPLPPGHPDDEEPRDEKTVVELEAEAAARAVDVDDIDGSGQDGRVVKADLVHALDETPEPPAGRPPLGVVAEGAASHVIAVDTPTPTED